jgi:hypothetical protein
MWQHLMESIDTDDDDVLAELTKESEEVSRKRKEVHTQSEREGEKERE